MATCLNGCVTLPGKAPQVNNQYEVSRITDNWASTPALTVVDMPGPAVIKIPGVLPEKLKTMEMEITASDSYTVNDLMSHLGMQGIASLVADPEIGTTPVPVQNYKGSVTGLLSAVSKGLGVSFSWDDGVLIAGRQGNYIFSIVQDDSVGDRVKADLEGLGAAEIKFSRTSGLLSFNADWKRHDDIMEYMERITEGMGTISLQVAVITVALDKNQKRGFDWSAMSAELKGGSGASARKISAEDSVGLISQVDSTLSATGLGLTLNHRTFSMTGLLSVLSQYGETRTAQNVILKTLPSTEVKIRSGSSIPYVSSVSSAVADGGTTGGAQFETVETGTTITITPNMDAKSGMITMPVDMQIKTLLGFVDVSAGDQVGSTSQPSLQEQEFNDISRIALGNTVILGGVTYESIADTRQSLAGLQRLPVGHQDLDTKREALFIVIRPTAVMHQFDSSKSVLTEKDAVNEMQHFNSRPVAVEKAISELDEATTAELEREIEPELELETPPEAAKAMAVVEDDYHVNELNFEGEVE